MAAAQSGEPAGRWERGVWNQIDQGLSLGSAISWLPTGLGQVFDLEKPQFPHL